MAVPELDVHGAPSQISRVALRLPGRREMMWISADVAMTDWEVGEVVFFRNSYWRVLDRRSDGETVTLTLGTQE
jgi:hypothetical protein